MWNAENLMSRNSWKYSSKNNKKMTSEQKDEAFLSFLSAEKMPALSDFIILLYFYFILFFIFHRPNLLSEIVEYRPERKLLS